MPGNPPLRRDSPPATENQPESLLGGMMNQMTGMAGSMMNSLSGAIGGLGTRRQDEDNDMNVDNQDQDMPAGRYFLQKFREKNGMTIDLPAFVEGTFEEVSQECQKLKRPIFFYLHDHKGDSCTIVDQTVIGESIVKDLISKFICVGVNVNSTEGENIREAYSLPGAPYMAIMHFDETGTMQNIGSRYSEEINVNALFEMADTAYDMMSAMFDPMMGVPEFNIADSNLNIVETLDVKAEIEDQIKNNAAPTGFVEPRVRQQQIDPTTGYPVGLTEQQIKDKQIKEEQKKELEEAMAADRIKLESAAQAEKDRQQKNLEEAKKAQAEIEKQRMKEFKADQVKASLPAEPAEGPDASTIQFRLPNSNNVQRRFLKTEKVQLLYDYILSLGEENGVDGHGDIEILQNFPRKVFDQVDKTIESEGLHPRAKLYVKEQEDEEEE